MSQQVTIEERLSALYDGEMSSFEGQRLTAELLVNPARKTRWLRYQMISDVMRGEMDSNWDAGFADRVMQGIDAEPDYALKNAGKPSQAWLKPVAGFAMAATVAAISIFTLNFATNTGSGIETAQSEIPAEEATEGQIQTLATLPQDVRQVNTANMTPAVSINGAVLSDPRMDSYLATHAEFASRPGFLSRVRIVGYNSDVPEEER